MPTAKLTRKVIDALEAGERDRFHWDAELAGFGVRSCRPYALDDHQAPAGHETPTADIVSINRRQAPLVKASGRINARSRSRRVDDGTS